MASAIECCVSTVRRDETHLAVRIYRFKDCVIGSARAERHRLFSAETRKTFGLKSEEDLLLNKFKTGLTLFLPAGAVKVFFLKLKLSGKSPAAFPARSTALCSDPFARHILKDAAL